MQLLHKLDRFYVSPRGHRLRLGEFRCPACRSIVVRMISNGSVARSCGCHRPKGPANVLFKHGKKHHPLYCVWESMRKRCHNPKAKAWPNYGGRGIKVCAEWNDFTTFLEWALAHGWAEGLCLDRINNDGNYTPDNCRFVTHQINTQNSRVAKITLATARAIRRALAAGQNHKAIVQEFSVSLRTVQDISQGNTWHNALP